MERIGSALGGLALLAGLLFPTAAGALGFGEMTLHSRIGENLLAEVPLIGGNNEVGDASCYVLAPHPGTDLPVITRARIRLVRNNNSAHLVIIGSKAIADPVFTISLRANCGLDMQHDYVLMPDAPVSLSETVERAMPTQGKRNADTERGPERPLPESRNSRLANRQQAISDTAMQKPARPKRGDELLFSPPARKLRQAANPAPVDRLILSTAPPEPGPGETPVAANGSQLEERLLKMETSLRTLNQELDTLNTSLKLSTEMMVAKHELQVAQSLQQPGPTTTVQTAALAQDPAPDHWQALLLSTLVSSSTVAGLAAFVGRRKKAGRKLS